MRTPEEFADRIQSFITQVVFGAFGIRVGLISAYAQSDEEVPEQLMPGGCAHRKTPSFFGQLDFFGTGSRYQSLFFESF